MCEIRVQGSNSVEGRKGETKERKIGRTVLMEGSKAVLKKSKGTDRKEKRQNGIAERE